ncbi:MAG TPA: DUF1707 domain-containing protein [Blastococcus sp.]|jgi:hypothetical protein|nr:DUF1707 domain-containing protein [Blastococcus sp.]
MTASEPPPVRASDAERHAVVAVLHDAVARGLLTLAEGDERMAAAYSARFVHELPPLTADLPAAPVPAPVAPGWRALTLLAWLQLRTLFTRTTVRDIRARPRLALAVVALVAVLSIGAMAGGVGDHGYGPGPRIERAQHVGPH